MYKLLTFCEDYADEHNVPALAVMTEEGYQKWLMTPSGELNDKYDEQLAAYKAMEFISTNFWDTLKKEGITNTTLIPKDRLDLIELEQNYRKNYKYSYNYPKKVKSNIRAWLGNGSDGFEEEYSDLYLMEEFVPKYVKVYDVSDKFAETFNKADLSRLSLCNIFCIDEY